MNFPNGTYLLFDNDCGVCTTFSHFLKRLLGSRAELVPMHLTPVEQEGMKHIPDEYWTSFHIVQHGKWTSEGDAIIKLASLFPFGWLLKRIVAIPPVHSFLLFILKSMQEQRKMECTIDL